MFMMLFILHDNLVWAATIKIMDLNKDEAKKSAYKFRFLGAACSFALVVLGFIETKQKLDKLPEDQKLQEKQGLNVVGLVKNGADLLTYGSNTKWFSSVLDLDDGKMGLFGAVSALAGGYPEWLKI